MSFISEHSNDPVVRWFRKHSDEPLTASKRWVVEHFQFGSCMFDPTGLRDRYKLLVAWQGGLWVNYWTQTAPRPKSRGGTDIENREEQVLANDVGLLANGVAPSTSTPASPSPTHSSGDPPDVVAEPDTTKHGPLTKSEAKVADKTAQKSAKAEEKQRQKAEKDRQKQLKKLQKQHEANNELKPGRHFIVLPTGLGQVLGGGEKWEKVTIAGVEDEVAAHCGLFIKGQNLEYEAFVDRVGKRVLQWCEQMK
jgi:hypothetical protein